MQRGTLHEVSEQPLLPRPGNYLQFIAKLAEKLDFIEIFKNGTPCDAQLR
jgi:hypothetical protein